MVEIQSLCRICRKQPALSYEHLPPKAAFNSFPLRRFGILEWLEKENDQQLVLGALMRRGSGGYTLCSDCNSKTGSWYAPELISWSRAGVAMLQQLTPDDVADRRPEDMAAKVIFHDVNPLRFIKQVVTMMLSVNGFEFSEANPELSEFVLNRGKKGLASKYRFRLVLFRGPNARFMGLSAGINAFTGEIDLLSEIAYPPFSYIVYVDCPAKEIPVGEITKFVDYEYDEQVDLNIDLQVGFGHSMLPVDFRSAAAIKQDKQKSGNPH